MIRKRLNFLYLFFQFLLKMSQSKEFGGKRKNLRDILETQSIGIFEQVPWDELKIEIKDELKEFIEKEKITKQKLMLHYNQADYNLK